MEAILDKIGPILGILSILAIAGMIVVPIAPHIRLRYETYGKKENDE